MLLYAAWINSRMDVNAFLDNFVLDKYFDFKYMIHTGDDLKKMSKMLDDYIVIRLAEGVESKVNRVFEYTYALYVSPTDESVYIARTAKNQSWRRVHLSAYEFCKLVPTAEFSAIADRFYSAPMYSKVRTRVEAEGEITYLRITVFAGFIEAIGSHTALSTNSNMKSVGSQILGNVLVTDGISMGNGTGMGMRDLIIPYYATELVINLANPVDSYTIGFIYPYEKIASMLLKPIPCNFGPMRKVWKRAVNSWHSLLKSNAEGIDSLLASARNVESYWYLREDKATDIYGKDHEDRYRYVDEVMRLHRIMPNASYIDIAMYLLVHEVKPSSVIASNNEELYSILSKASEGESS